VALFSSGSRSVKLYFKGDSSQLDRTLSKTEYKLKRFERVAGKSGLNSGMVGSFGKGGAAIAGAGLFAVGLKKVINASKEAEVVLGQTSVAVSQAGISWQQNAATIDAAATRISKASAFDDEAVLQSFQVFVRGQKDVGKSLELAALAADVARGRYTDLESATQLVNKAAMGQIGALRRAGIQIDKNATSTQALATLQAAYGGAAVRYANSAAGAQDKLNVSLENLSETLGSAVLPYFTELVSQADSAVSVIDRLARSFDGLNASLPGGGSVGGAIKKGLFLGPNVLQDLFGSGVSPAGSDVAGNASAFASAYGLGALTAAGTGMKGFQSGAVGAGPNTGVPSGLVNQELDARLSGSGAALRAVLEKQAAWLRKDILSTLPEDQPALKQALLSVTDEIKAMDAEMIQSAQNKAAAARSAKEKLKEANRRAVEAFRDQANAIKSAVLSSFDTKQSKISNARALEDATAVLKQARMLGGPETIKLAMRDVNDAKAAIQRQKIEQMAFRVTEGPKGPVNTLAAGNIVININGATDPDKIAKQVVAAINRSKKQTTGQSRGRHPGWLGG